MYEPPDDPTMAIDDEDDIAEKVWQDVPQPTPRRVAYIEVPQLAEAEKAVYKSILGSAGARKSAPVVDEIVGELADENGVLWYYARFQSGLSHRFSAPDVLRDYPSLLKIYERRKREDDLPPFDPSSRSVHSDSRVVIKLTISRSRASSVLTSVTSRGAGYSDDESDSDSNDDSDAFSSKGRTTRAKTRREANPTLPFSPRKTRSKKIYVVSDSNESDSGAGHYAPTRRSSRKKSLKVPVEVSDDEAVYEPKPSRNREARLKKKHVRPEYGLVRPITDLDAELDSDDENWQLKVHRSHCEKCLDKPTDQLLAAYKKKGKSKSKKRRNDEDDDSENELEHITAKGGWVRCLTCPVSAHWRCISQEQREQILQAARVRDHAQWLKTLPPGTDPESLTKEAPRKRPGLFLDETTEFTCGSCSKAELDACIECMETPHAGVPLSNDSQDGHQSERSVNGFQTSKVSLRFRCLTCKRSCHYEHLPSPRGLEEQDLTSRAAHYQENWLCSDCVSFMSWGVDKIIAWRPSPANSVEPARKPGELPPWKGRLPRQYLIKWNDRSFRRTTWVPHMWLLSTHPGKLRNFITDGPKIDIRSGHDNRTDRPTTEEDTGILGPDSRDSSAKPSQVASPNKFPPLPDAQDRIPVAWKTVDRILQVRVWKSYPKKKKGRSRMTIESEDEEDDEDRSEYDAAFLDGEVPSERHTESLEAWEKRHSRPFSIQDATSVVWALIKWSDLGYEDATWDAPPHPERETAFLPAFTNALGRFLAGRQVEIPRLNPKLLAKYEDRPPKEFRRKHAIKHAEELDLGQAAGLNLMDFQVQGFNWLCDNWWNKQPCILADEMGLGKTVQIASFIGKVATAFEAFPALVVVPNSTITNWVREFERWAPCLRVVPFFGEAKAREVIKKFELIQDFHVLIATYETLLNVKDFAPVFKAQKPWKILVIDEGQRLKSDTSLLFKRLNELDSMHRILMTGTPLNNNIRELFNLMHFLDPSEWNDLEALEKEYSELTEELVKQLHERLRPYFLRRIKSEVLKLPPKNEVIVPVSMAPLQKEVYRSILTHNADILNGLAVNPAMNGAGPKTKINNVLMQLRKCLQHPYLYAEDIEPAGLSTVEAHGKLIDASAKFRLLKAMLPKLRARGHRVLLFSQFVIALNVIEDFLAGEGYTYLRLDGSTKGSERQKGMDEFNKEGSDVFIYLLSTRAGGVGINLYSADTVIIFDPDFNPHQDLQAIARAYRYGQKKTCLVFKLMVKDSAEERIMQIGKKKLVLDHLIVQKMDDDEDATENVQSILTYGAQALFNAEEGSKDIIYTDNDLDSLILKTEQQPQDSQADSEKATSFTFAKIWTADKEDGEEVGDEDHGDSWTQTLQTINAERDKIKKQEVTSGGRGTRRKATKLPNHDLYFDGESPQKASKSKGKKRASVASSDASAYALSSGSEDSSAESRANDGLDQLPCGLCNTLHGTGFGQCRMTESSQFLAEYREMLMDNSDEPLAVRLAAIKAIDETLYLRGDGKLLAGQPLYLVAQEPDEPTLPKTSHPSSSKRPSSPTPIPGSSAMKKPRPPSNCLVCNMGIHDLEACPLVNQGSKTVSKEIKRLENVPGSKGTVHALQKILSRHKKIEAQKGEQ